MTGMAGMGLFSRLFGSHGDKVAARRSEYGDPAAAHRLTGKSYGLVASSSARTWATLLCPQKRWY